MSLDLNADNIQEIEKASEELRKMLNARGVLLTLSSKGICINTEDEFLHTPCFKRNVVDVSGAGDTVISVASLCLASNVDYVNLSILASLAGGIVCEEVGVLPINKERLLIEAKKIIVKWRK
jgi:bifunctional ADP-heptose synthase (sugar kinase/adenylyltransferase)